MPKVSVIIPTFKRPISLLRAVRSVQSQSESDFEVIVVDDGSPSDSARDVVLGCQDPRLVYLRVPVSRGPAAARNAGIAKATAAYIAFLDDDDEWLADKLKIQLPVLEHSGASVGAVHTARITVDEIAGKRTTTRSPATFDPHRGNTVTTSTVLMKRVCFDAVGLFDEKLRAGSDFDMWVRLSEVFQLQYIDVPLVRYFIHSSHRISDDDAIVVEAGERLLAKHHRIYSSSRRRHCLLHALLALRYHRLGETTKARSMLRRAFCLWPLHPQIYKTYLRMLFSARDNRESPRARRS